MIEIHLSRGADGSVDFMGKFDSTDQLAAVVDVVAAAFDRQIDPEILFGIVDGRRVMQPADVPQVVLPPWPEARSPLRVAEAAGS